MATSPNPFTGSGWSPTPPGGGPMGNPLFGWPGQNVNQNFGSPSSSPTVSGPPQGAWGNPGNLANPFSNAKDITRNTGVVNLETGQFRNELLPIFANLFLQNAGPAADFFKTRMNLGDPFYQARQANAFGQGVQQNQNAAALTNQELAQRGYGYGPSGTSAATLGAMNMQGGQNLVQNFLNTLFANDAYAMQAAQGLAGVAGMENPSSLFGNVSTPGSTQGPNTFEQIMQGIGSLFGSKGIPTGNLGGSSGGGS